MTITPIQAIMAVVTIKIRKNATGIADTATNIRSDKAIKGWSSKYRPTREFINATTCGQKKNIPYFDFISSQITLKGHSYFSEKYG